MYDNYDNFKREMVATIGNIEQATKSLLTEMEKTRTWQHGGLPHLIEQARNLKDSIEIVDYSVWTDASN